jgi:hypothetical protein
MSKSDTPSSSGEQDTLTKDERSVFERLADRHEDDDVGRICELALQSSSPKEDANS